MKCILLRGSVLGEQCRPWDGEHSDLALAMTLTGLMLIRVLVLSGLELAVQLNSFSEYFSRAHALRLLGQFVMLCLS